MASEEPKPRRHDVDMSAEAIAARLRRVVELNRLCRSLAAAVPAPLGEAPGEERPQGPGGEGGLSAR